MELSELCKRHEIVIVEPTDGNDGFIVSYEPEGMTLENLRAFTKKTQSEETDNIDDTLLFLAQVNMQWNLKKNGEPVPTDAETLKHISHKPTVLAAKAIGDHMSVEKKDLTTSETG